MGDEYEMSGATASDDGNGQRRKRRRKRSRRKRRPEGAEATPVVVEPTPVVQRFARRQMVEVSSSPVTAPASGRNPQKKRSSRARRTKPGSVAARRRRISRVEMTSLQDWLGKLTEPMLSDLYRGLGGQPKRVSSPDRMIQLAVRAIVPGSRLSTLLKQLHERDRKALAALLQAGGLAHAEEFRRMLVLAYGGHDREWKRSMTLLAERGLVMATDQQDESYFYVVPEPLTGALLEHLEDEMLLPTFEHEDVRVIDHKPFSPPLDFSITSMATYIAQTGVRLTQRHDVYRHDQEAMDEFFAQLWEPNSELFQFHLDFLMMHGMVVLRGDHLRLDAEVTEEWLQLEPEDQRDLIFQALEKRFEMSEWVLWAVHGAEGAWVAERPLVAQYRHWKRGREWRARYTSGVFANARTNERESFTFAPLVQCGLLEMGMWGQEKFYRLTVRAQALLEPSKDEGFRQFYLTPDFKMMAPAGLAPILLYRMGEIAEFSGCDRANTYKITEQSIEAALEAGWRRDDVLQFLRDNSQLGLPENVEQTLKGWIGHRGDVQFHDLVLVTVHRSQIRRLEGNKRVKPYLLHRFAPGMYAVDRSKKEEIARVLADSGFAPAKDTRSYPGNPEVVEARAALHKQVGEARDAASDPMSRSATLVDPGVLRPVPGTRMAQRKRSEPDRPPLLKPGEARGLIDAALAQDTPMEMVYLAKNGQRLNLLVQAQRLAFKGEAPVLVGLDINEDARRTFVLDRIERLRLKEDLDE
jgi:hypothetical protein